MKINLLCPLSVCRSGRGRDKNCNDNVLFLLALEEKCVCTTKDRRNRRSDSLGVIYLAADRCWLLLVVVGCTQALEGADQNYLRPMTVDELQ